MNSAPGNGELRPTRFLILEPDSEGHPLEWLRHLLRHAGRAEEIERIYFVLAPELCSALAADLKHRPEPRLELIPLGSWEHRLCQNRLLVVSAFARWWAMRRYLRQTDADVGHFLSLDLLSLPLALGLGAAGRRIGGILFRPSVHYRDLENAGYRPGWRERLRDLRKDVLYRGMLMNSALDVVLTLDPYFPGYAASRYPSGHKVRAVTDPAHPLIAAEPGETAITDPLPFGRTVFCMFGFLSERKGVLTLLDALCRLPAEIAKQTAVVLAGRIDPAIRERVAELSAQLFVNRPELWVQIENRRLSAGEITRLIEQSHVVLAPYQRFVGSSGVLLWAAQAARPLLTQDFGLVGSLVRDHSLGLTADATDPAALALAISRMVREGPESFIDADAARRFAQQRTPEAFAEGVYHSLRKVGANGREMAA